MDFISLLGKPDVNTKKWTFTLFTFQRPRSKSCFYCWLAVCMCKYVQFRVPEFALVIINPYPRIERDGAFKALSERQGLGK
jgi:hypothetical protein